MSTEHPTAQEVMEAARANIPWVKTATERGSAAEYLALAIIHGSHVPESARRLNISPVEIVSPIVDALPELGDFRARTQLPRVVAWALSLQDNPEVAAFILATLESREFTGVTLANVQGYDELRTRVGSLVPML